MAGRGRKKAEEPGIDALAGKDRTEEAFLDAAERLFAKFGFEGAKVRAIAEDAGANLGALHYYWGSKEALYKAVCERRLRPITEERLRRFDAVVAAAAGGKPDLRMVLEAAILPAAEQAQQDSGEPSVFGALMSRTLSDPSPVPARIVQEIFDEASFRYVRLLRQCCDHLDDGTFFLRLHVVLGGSQHLLSGAGRIAHLSHGRFKPSDFRTSANTIITALMAALLAPA